jgi:serine/threonine-protein kinase
VSSTEIAGRYRLESRLGFGGMSTVHLAFDQRLERRVAVKLQQEELRTTAKFGRASWREREEGGV